MSAGTVSAGLRIALARVPVAALVGAALVLAVALAVEIGVESPAAAGLGETQALDGAGRIARWVAGVDRGHEATELAWKRRDTQPPLTGLVHGLAWLALADAWGGRAAVAFANLVAGLVSLTFLFALARRRFGFAPAVVASLALVLAPGFLASLGGAGPEPLFGALLMALVATTWLAERRPRVGVVVAIVMTLAALAHPVGIVLVVPLTAHALLRERPRALAREDGALRVGPLPLYLFLGLALPIALLPALWPWLDVQTGKRLAEYFFRGYASPHPPFALFGETFVQARDTAPPFWTAPLLWLVRVPIPILALASVGAGRSLRDVWRRWRSREGVPDGPERDLMLPVLLLGTLLLLHALDGSPWYDGNDGLVAVLPLGALLAAGGLRGCLRALTLAGPRLRRFGAPALVTLVLLAAGADRLSAGDAPDLWFNGLVGGTAGAAESGLQLRPTPAIEGPVLTWMNEHLPEGAAVAFAPATEPLRELANALQNAGALRRDLFFGALFDAHFVIVPYAPERAGYPDAVALTSRLDPVAEIAHGGVPLARIYRLE